MRAAARRGWPKEPHTRIDRQRLVRERRVAGAEDDVTRRVHAELFLERLPNVDLGDDAEARLFQSRHRALPCGIERKASDAANAVLDFLRRRACTRHDDSMEKTALFEHMRIRPARHHLRACWRASHLPVDPRVATDLRLLKLAELYEDAYERFVRDVALRTIADPTMRARLLQLAPPEDDHAKRIHAERERVEASLEPEDEPAVILGALTDVLEVERAARNFYLASLQETYDPKIAQLFRQLAREEEKHTDLARGILRDAEATLGPAPGAEPEDLAILEAPPLREGVSDFGVAGRLPFRELPPVVSRRRGEPEH